MKVETLVSQVKELETKLGHIEDGLGEIRGEEDLTDSYNVEKILKDKRYSVHVLFKEHQALSQELKALLNKEIYFEEDKTNV